MVKVGVTTTVVCAMNVNGQSIPPMMVFKKKQMKLEFIDHAPTGAIGGCSKNGSISTDLFIEYICDLTSDSVFDYMIRVVEYILL